MTLHKPDLRGLLAVCSPPIAVAVARAFVLVIAQWERRVKKLVSRIFDLTVDTSMEGILKLSFLLEGQDGAAYFNARKMVKLCEMHGGKIFEQSLWREPRTVGVF